MASHNEFGRAAEAAAAGLLERNGWTILARNWRDGHREIDIIAGLGETIAFVEVKARASAARGHPLEFIDRRKRRDLARAARAWVRAHASGPDAARARDFRFDAIHVLRGVDGRLWAEHVPDAWRL